MSVDVLPFCYHIAVYIKFDISLLSCIEFTMKANFRELYQKRQDFTSKMKSYNITTNIKLLG